VHVAYLVVDAVIDLAWTRERFKDRPDEFFVKAKAIAEEIWHVCTKIAARGRSMWNCGPLVKRGERKIAHNIPPASLPI